jgi:hypothetical protein
VSDDRVERVRRAVGGDGGRSAKREVEERRDDCVARVLRHGFDRCARQTAHVEVRRVAADEGRRERARCVDVVRRERLVHREGGAIERASAERAPERRRLEQEPPSAAKAACREPERGPGTGDEEHREECAAASAVGPDVSLERARGVAEAGDGVEPDRVPEQQVGAEAGEQEYGAGSRCSAQKSIPRRPLMPRS